MFFQIVIFEYVLQYECKKNLKNDDTFFSLLVIWLSVHQLFESVSRTCSHKKMNLEIQYVHSIQFNSVLFI